MVWHTEKWQLKLGKDIERESKGLWDILVSDSGDIGEDGSEEGEDMFGTVISGTSALWYGGVSTHLRIVLTW